MTLPVVLQSKITKCTVTMRKSIRFPTGGSLPRPYNGVSRRYAKLQFTKQRRKSNEN